MATGRSGQLVVTGAKDPLTSPSSSSSSSRTNQRHHPHSPPTEGAYFLQRRFEDTALVVFEQHARRLKEVSPGHYTPLPSSTPAPPSLFQIPGLDLPEHHDHRAPAPSGSEKASTGSAAAPLGSDKASTSSAASSAHRADSASPRSGSSSEAKASFRNDSESASSVDRAPEGGCERTFGGVEENGVWDQGHAHDALPCAADGTTVSFSDDSSVDSSAPDSDLVEEGHLPGTSVAPAFQTPADVAEDTYAAEDSVDRDGDRYFTHTAVGVPQNGQIVRVQVQNSGPVEREVPVQLQPHRINSTSHSQSKPEEPPSFSERSSEPVSPNGLNEPRSLHIPSAVGEPRSPKEPVSLSSRLETDELSVSSDEEVQITRL